MHDTCKASNCNAQGHSAGKKNKGGYLNSDGVCFMEFENKNHKDTRRYYYYIFITGSFSFELLGLSRVVGGDREWICWMIRACLRYKDVGWV